MTIREIEVLNGLLKDILNFEYIDSIGYYTATLEDCEFKIDIGDFKKGEKVKFLNLDFFKRELYNKYAEPIKSAKLKITEDKA
jgi:hypothetical protein